MTSNSLPKIPQDDRELGMLVDQLSSEKMKEYHLDISTRIAKDATNVTNDEIRLALAIMYKLNNHSAGPKRKKSDIIIEDIDIGDL